ncbi:MAG: sulfite reductase subunit alpha [Opitutaceae bacterium]|jgi:sulfite reductase (NADPH) flavoprotein alpha-component
MPSAATASIYNKDNPFPARILENRLLSRPGSEKDTRHFVLSLIGSGLSYKAGDSLGVYPMNPPKEVNALLSLLGASGRERVVLPRATVTMPLKLALFANLSLDGPTRKFLETLQSRASDPLEKSKIERLLASENKEQLGEYLRQRHHMDILSEFPGIRLAPQELVDHLRRLSPRLYSIASSPKVYPDEIHLTVVVLRYQMNGRDRVGVCSSFLADRVTEIETLVPVFVVDSQFGPPEDPSKDCIMVGPGSGIAPFRAFVQDRVAVGATGRNWIFFGDQSRATDYLYEGELEDALRTGKVQRLDLAWSRDQVDKVYVQNKMRENSAELWSWLRSGAYFYVCGDAKRMAKDVESVLLEIIATEGRLEPAAAADYLKTMKKERRYQRDVY